MSTNHNSPLAMNATLTAPAKFDRRAIAVAAWSLVKTAGKTLSEGMKAAWVAAKQTVKAMYKQEDFAAVNAGHEAAYQAEQADLSLTKNHYRIGYVPRVGTDNEWVSIDWRTVCRLVKAQETDTLAATYPKAAEALAMIFGGNAAKWKAWMSAQCPKEIRYITTEQATAKLAALNAAGNYNSFDDRILEA